MNFKFDDSMIEPRLLELAKERRGYVDQAASSLSGQLDAEVRAALDRAVPGWTLENVIERLRWQTYVQHPGVETLLLDGQPILELQPPTTGEVYDKGRDVFTLTISRDVKRFA